MTRAAHSFGDVAEFTIWAHENGEMFMGTSHTASVVAKKYKNDMGRTISPGAIKRVFASLKLPLHSKRGTQRKAYNEIILAREIVTLNENLRAMAEAFGYPAEALKKAGHLETLRKLAGNDED